MNNAFLDLIEMVGTGKNLFSQMVIRHHHLVSCSFLIGILTMVYDNPDITEYDVILYITQPFQGTNMPVHPLL